jgi:hypothetical protein
MGDDLYMKIAIDDVFIQDSEIYLGAYAKEWPTEERRIETSNVIIILKYIINT